MMFSLLCVLGKFCGFYLVVGVLLIFAGGVTGSLLGFDRFWVWFDLF